MNPRDLELRNLLRKEVTYKCTQSSTAFAVWAIFIFFYCFGCTKYELIIKLSMIVVFTVSILRLMLAKKINKIGHVSAQHWRYMIFYVWMNALGWSLAFNFASYELKLSGIHFIAATTMLAGFVAASLVSLAYDALLFLPFQGILLLPQLGVIAVLYYSGKQVDALPLIPIYIMYFLYQLRQFKDYNSHIKQRLNYQLDLEHSNQELQRSQDALISQTTKLVHTSRLAALGEMSAGIAHEVNNPLAIISGSIQQIEKLVSRGKFDPETILRLSAKSQTSIDRVTKIIKGLRHFSQQSDSLPKVVTPIQDIIHDTTSFCSEMLRARYIKLLIDPIPDVEIECHPIQISQVLINLIKNAEDALESEINPEERWVRISFRQANEVIFIQVSNGGAAITKEVESKLFQPFFTTKAIGKGTGLGLSISHGLMREHGGDLVFDSLADKTTFILQIPSSTH
ncbi:sensor histidine kinase [Peredibacter starrii]|uniref:histidine kinase n=1 Tax=Peredibacter starrii TaxID=28202 RepID=A0AAX4HPD9_9BACT|nr:ATP-binding protein [Peredibacter starrii]WPU64824.1 ATP-binding protein [Peredibacter starrii]